MLVNIKILAICLLLLVSITDAATETRYYRNDYALGTEDTNNPTLSISPNGTGANQSYIFSADIIILHIDSTTTPIATSVAVLSTIYEWQMEYRTATWDCPQINIESTDKIIISENLNNRYDGKDHVAQYSWTSEPLGADRLDAATWTFTRYCGAHFPSHGQEPFNSAIVYGSDNGDQSYITNFRWTKYIDIGLHFYDGSKIIKIACEPTSSLTSPLRISKNGTTYGIVLVDSSDLNASTFRIKTSSGIKALRKLL